MPPTSAGARRSIGTSQTISSAARGAMPSGLAKAPLFATAVVGPTFYAKRAKAEPGVTAGFANVTYHGTDATSTHNLSHTSLDATTDV